VPGRPGPAPTAVPGRPGPAPTAVPGKPAQATAAAPGPRHVTPDTVQPMPAQLPR
jgi:hypothetical protein